MGGGTTTMRHKPITVADFSEKLHENEKIEPGRGGGASLAPPFGSANATYLILLNLNFKYPDMNKSRKLILLLITSLGV